jgi:hypothetical protein
MHYIRLFQAFQGMRSKEKKGAFAIEFPQEIPITVDRFVDFRLAALRKMLGVQSETVAGTAVGTMSLRVERSAPKAARRAKASAKRRRSLALTATPFWESAREQRCRRSLPAKRVSQPLYFP